MAATNSSAPVAAPLGLGRPLRWVGHWPVALRFGLAGLAGALGYGLAPAALPAAGRAVLAWDAFAGTGLALLWCVLATADAARTRAVAGRESPGWLLAFVFLPVALGSSLLAVTLLLSTGMMPTLPLATRGWHVGLAVVGVGAAWALLHTLFTLRYAYLYYNADAGPGGLAFPDDEPRPPTYLDFAYFAFVVGMTSQTSDVAITRLPLRRAVLLHSLLSFAFNTAVVALSISGLVGVL